MMRGEKGTQWSSGALGTPQDPAPSQLPWQDESSPETHHNLSLCKVGVLKPSSEAITKCHLK